MLDFLQNQWVSGIVCGIISGIVVFYYTTWLLRRKENSTYLEQITNANVDIIRTLKPYIAEKGLPEKEIIDAIISSTARKYKVKNNELYSIRIICEELIYEIIENVYVSADKKNEYAIQLKDYLNQLNREMDKSSLISDIENEIKNSYIAKKSENVNNITKILGLFISIGAAIITLLINVIVYNEFGYISKLINNLEPIVTIIVSICASVTCYLMVTLLELTDKDKEEHNKNKK